MSEISLNNFYRIRAGIRKYRIWRKNTTGRPHVGSQCMWEISIYTAIERSKAPRIFRSVSAFSFTCIIEFIQNFKVRLVLGKFVTVLPILFSISCQPKLTLRNPIKFFFEDIPTPAATADE